MQGRAEMGQKRGHARRRGKSGSSFAAIDHDQQGLCLTYRKLCTVATLEMPDTQHLEVCMLGIHRKQK